MKMDRKYWLNTVMEDYRSTWTALYQSAGTL